jgi:tRNA pseudouridine13 synthase
LDISSTQIHIAGIKDAKAVTAQYIAIEGVSKEEAQRVKVRDIQIHPVGYLQKQLSSYYLLGNRFHITISKVRHPHLTIKKRIVETIEELKAIGGVPNFFGHQRFGTTRPITHLVGKALVQGNIKKAAMLFIAKSFPQEHPDSREAREEFGGTQDPVQAYKHFPKQLRYERLMLRHLARRPDDFAGAFKTLPIKLRELFVQAYQSYLFNNFLSQRILEGFGLGRVCSGDYVVNVERSGLPMVSMSKMVTSANTTETNERFATGKLRLALPLIGFRQRLSQGRQGEIEKRILEEEEITLGDFRIRAIPQISSRGELRTALACLKNFKIDEVLPTDLSNCRVKVSFALHRGSYATIVLRELMKPRNPIASKF